MDVRASHPAVDQIPSTSPGYARHIGRIGALAVTLGVGAALATSLGAGTAWAEDTGSTSASSGPDSSTSTSDRTRRTGADAAKQATATPRQSTQTGARVSRDSKVTAATAGTARPSVASASKPRGTALSVRAVTAPKRATADRAPAPQSQPAGAVITAPRSNLDTAPASTEADTGSAPELSRATASVEVAEAVAAPSPSTAAGDTAPADSPALWALLAWTRRSATENIDTTGALVPTAVTTGENSAVEDSVSTDVVEGTTGTVENVEAGGITGDTAVVGDVLAGDGTNVTSSAAHTVQAVLEPGAGEYQFDLNELITPVVGGLLPVVVLEEPLHGTVTIDGDGMLTYRPDPKYTGEDTFTIGSSTLLGLDVFAAIQFQLSVTSVNQTPWTESVGYGIAIDGAISGDVMQYSGGGDGPLSVAVTGGPEYGMVKMESGGTFYYAPPKGWVGIDSFSYTITDADGDQVSATLTIYVGPSAPVAINDTATVKAGDKVTIDVLKNDQHSDGELKIETVIQPAHGSVEYDPYTRTFTYTADAGQASGSDVFSYSIIDGYGQRSTATVTIEIEGKTTGAVDDSAAVGVGGTISIDVLSNDQYAGGTVKVSVVNSPRHGKVQWDEDTRTFIYTAGNTIPRDADTFTYSITDGSGATTTAVVTVKIEGKPLGPIANDDHVTTPNTTPVTIDVLANDDAPGEKPPTVRIDSPPRSGKVELVDGKLVYTPDPSFVGSVSIGYSITDPQGLQSTATVTVTVTGKEYAEHHFTVGQGSTLHVPGSGGLLSNPAHQGWTVSMVQHPGNGAVVLHEDGTFTYTPESGFLGEDSFVVYVSDGKTETKLNVYISVTEATVGTEPEPQPVVQPVGFTSSALALGGGRTTAECTDYYWPEIVDPDTVWPTCSLLYVRDDFNQVR